jgi:predicted transposase/invertase (TIGR01784 family)
MSDTTLTLERVFEEAGLTAKWEARGRAEGEARGKAEVARNLIKIGLSLEKVAQATELDLETVKSLAQS